MEGIHPLDWIIFITYMAAMLGVGFYFFEKNTTNEDYYVGGRNMTATHIGLSVVATDVGGGFSIGLGGLGFAIGISGSWMLFTGLLGAWLTSVFLIPKVYRLGNLHRYFSFPQVLAHYYDYRVAMMAGIVSFAGYLGFTGSQILAGAKLASAAFPGIPLNQIVLMMGLIAVIYTVAGGLKAVIYTDTVQWIILMVGLLFVGIPVGYVKLGGWNAICELMPEGHMSLSGISASQFVNWLITIVPIWFVGMTLYQRIFACRDEKTAKKAWMIAGLFERPVMAFLGVILGVFARIAMDQGLFVNMYDGPAGSLDPELGLPMFLRNVLPLGLMGLLMSAYFSAIMSTADSCLMAASGNLITDVIKPRATSWMNGIRFSRILTLAIGTLSIFIALQMDQVLKGMLHSYAIMVAGMFIPALMILCRKKHSPVAALWCMIGGGGLTLGLTLLGTQLPGGLDPIFYGLLCSLAIYLIVSPVTGKPQNQNSV